ncbi:nucleoside deaminase [Gluconobacter morbifer]|uniref:tRNA-specific adenosine deaminase n=1 Tax=Gluconobacter morbifer G707 TaxID=1088869 RepID=G6XJT9_9PROT|nr:nucleoside deaminase [Gluconobacter morbifer]EHH67901.1 cytosine deaminase [Gluconobacter morbifer G707]
MIQDETSLSPSGFRTDARHAMRMALQAAQAAADRGEVPVGAVVLGPDGTVLSVASNRVEATHDASAHAELLAMQEAASRLGSPRLSGCTVVVTLEPCPMCAAAMVHFRIARVVFGAYDPKGGGVEHGPRLFERPGCLHRPDVIGGVRETEASRQLRIFFQKLRQRQTERLTDVSHGVQLAERNARS